jgi:tungstate transport system substrate-binding protein
MKWIGLGLLYLLSFLPGMIQAQPKAVLLATTTSTQDSGLLDLLLPIFEKRTGYFVKTIAVGSGQAIAMGQRGEADVLLVHSPDDEKKLIAEGYGINRRRVMYNDFFLVGPIEDPARVKGTKLASEAFKKIALTKGLFLSRGDHSGTHAREISIWRITGINPEREKWYQQTGLGMGQTLNVAAEKKGYTLTDRGTYLALKKSLRLDVLVEGDAILFNVYHVIQVNSAKWPKVNAAGARVFSDFLVSKEAQEIIRTFGVKKFGAPLFFPEAGKKGEEIER